MTVNPKERYCIYEALWHESRGESEEGIRAVLSVIQNRVYSNKYPESYCKVIRQFRQFSYVHQRTNRGLTLVPQPTQLQYDLANRMQELAMQALTGRFKNSFEHDVLWYHTKSVNPKWNKKMQVVATIGNHKFLKLKG